MSLMLRRRAIMSSGPKEQPNYLCFTALESGTFTLTMAASMPVGFYAYAAYSLDEGKTWTSANNVNSELVTLTTPTVNEGDTVMWKGKGTRVYGMVSTAADNCICFSSTCRFTAKGFLASFCTEKPKNETTTRMRSYGNIFNRCTTLVDASELILPEFTSAASAVFYGLFYGCTSLTAAPTLSSTTLSSQCYGYMFQGCTSLQTAPVLPALALINNCYLSMFQSCTSLSWIKMLATDNVNSNSSTANWVINVPNVSTTVFVKNINATWTTTGNNGVQTNWKVIYYDPTDDKYYTDQTKATECDDHGNPI